MIEGNRILKFCRIGQEIEEEVVHLMNGRGTVVVMGGRMSGESGMRIERGSLLGRIHGGVILVVVVGSGSVGGGRVGRMTKGIEVGVGHLGIRFVVFGVAAVFQGVMQLVAGVTARLRFRGFTGHIGI